MTADHQYEIADLPPGQVGQEIVEITGTERTPMLRLPPAVPPETKSDFVEALRRAYESGRQSVHGDQNPAPSPAMAERAARLLLTKAGALPEVHAAWREPLEPFCGNPAGFGPGGYSTHTLRITCKACTDKFGNTEDQLAEWERWTREGVPEDRRIPGPEVVAEARALRGR